MAPPPEPFPKKELSEKNLILTYCTSASSSLLVAYIVWVSVVPLLGLRRGGCTVLLPVFSHFIVIGGTYRIAKGELLFVRMKVFVPCPSFWTIKTLLSCSGSLRIWELSCGLGW